MALNPDTDGIVSAFRGIRAELARGRARSTMGKPASASTITANFLKKFEKKNPDRLNNIIDAWDSLLPARLRNKSSPKSVRGGVLYVDSVNSSVKQELTFCEKQILPKLKKLEDCSDIKKIRFL